MNAILMRRLAQAFSSEVEALDRHLVTTDGPKEFYSRSEMVFANAARPAWRIVILVPDPKGGDRFTIEIGWSKLQRVPRLSMRPSPQTPTEALEEKPDEYICRLSEICLGRDHWWPVVGDLSTAMEPALAMLAAVGLPFLDKAAA